MENLSLNLHPHTTSGSNFCFNRDDFMKNDFNVENFVVECRRHAPLEKLREDLAVYMKVLQNSMIELINKDYADFVNLSSNLVGMDKSIGNLSEPLKQLQGDIGSVKLLLDDAIFATEAKINERASIRSKKISLQIAMNIIETVDKIEVLLGIHKASDSTKKFVNPTSENQLSGNIMLERMACEFNKLQFLVSQSSSPETVQLLAAIQPRISTITNTLQYCLEGRFREALSSGNKDSLRQCLRTYSMIDRTKEVEDLFRKLVVKPYMAQILTEDHIRREGLLVTYAAVLDFVPKQCQLLLEITSTSAHSSDHVRGYDFLVNAVWPEIVSSIEIGISSIFAPGNPNVFFEKYTQSISFLEQFEILCGSQASIKRLRANPSYAAFMTKWSLPVYFQIRFQEIGGALESALMTPYAPSQLPELPFKLCITSTLWQCLHQCWHQSVFLAPLCHRFWKLTIQLISRFGLALTEIANSELGKKTLKTNDDKVLLKQGENETVIKRSTEELTGSNADTSNQKMSLSLIVSFIADIEHLSVLLKTFFYSVVKSAVEAQGIRDLNIFSESYDEVINQLVSLQPRFLQYITDELLVLCLPTVKLVNDIPRLYRKTNREVPTKCSIYISSLLKPLVSFVQENGGIISEANRQKCVTDVVTVIAEQYQVVTVELLTSVKKMEESLKRLKRAKTSSAQLDGKGVADDEKTKVITDDDKIRIQLNLDVKELCNQIDGLHLNPKDILPLVQLQQTIQDALVGCPS